MDDIENEALHSILQSPLFDIKMKEKKQYGSIQYISR